MIWWQNTINMHSSCKWTWWAFSGMYSTYVLLQADSACKNVHDLVHDVVPQKDMFLQGTYLFGSFVTFETVCPSSVFGRSGRRPSSSGHVPRGTRSCICTCFMRTWNFTIACAIAFSDRVHDRTNDRFQSVQGSNPWPCTWSIFMGPGFESLPVQHDLFVGPGFDSLALIARF